MTKKSSFYVDSDLSTIIALKGDLKGNIALSMPQNTASNIASAMMMGMAPTEEMTKSAIGELSSMIAGMASTMLTSAGLTLQISPPAIVMKAADIDPQEALTIDFETPSGKIELNIGFSI
ncbi:chemotaxis protein CheX [Alkaliphilus crotonatoxidans]